MPVRYFHIVFTVPSLLHKLFYVNQALCYEILMQSAGQSIFKAGENPRFLGAETGCVAILHTWGQALTYQPHVHLLVPAGGIDNDMMEWRKTNEKYFAPVKVLSSLFRGFFASAIYRHADKLVLPGTDENTGVESLRKMIYKSKWNVFAKPALNDAGKVIEYLGRYSKDNKSQQPQIVIGLLVTQEGFPENLYRQFCLNLCKQIIPANIGFYEHYRRPFELIVTDLPDHAEIFLPPNIDTQEREPAGLILSGE